MNKTLPTTYRSKIRSDLSFLKKDDSYVITNNLKKIIVWLNEQSKAVEEPIRIEIKFQNGQRDVYGGLITGNVYLDNKEITLAFSTYKVKADSTDDKEADSVWAEISLAYAVLENWRQIKADIQAVITDYMVEKAKSKFLKDFVA